jgi:hypothetical protein
MIAVGRWGRVVFVDISELSYVDVKRVLKATEICGNLNCLDLFQDTDPLEVVDLLVDYGLMKKKTLLTNIFEWLT